MLDQLAGLDVTLCDGYPVAADPQAAYKYAHGCLDMHRRAPGFESLTRRRYSFQGRSLYSLHLTFHVHLFFTSYICCLSGGQR